MPDLWEMLRAHLGACHGEALRYTTEEGLVPAPESPAASEQAAQGGLAHESPEWGPAPVTATYSLAAIQVAASLDNVDAIRRLLGDRPSAFGLVATCRAHLEAAARAWHLLDPTIGTRERVARGMNDRINALHERAKYEIPTVADTARRRLNVMVAAAEDLAYEVKPPGRFAPSLVDSPRQTSTVLIERFLGDDGLGVAAYRYLSAIAHGDALAIVAHAAIPDPEGDANVKRLFLKPRPAIEVVALAFLGLHHVMARRFERYGGNADEFNARMQAALVDLSTARSQFAPGAE